MGCQPDGGRDPEHEEESMNFKVHMLSVKSQAEMPHTVAPWPQAMNVWGMYNLY